MRSRDNPPSFSGQHANVQTLLGHKDPEVTSLYLDDWTVGKGVEARCAGASRSDDMTATDL